MNSETYGMFGPQGLLAKMETPGESSGSGDQSPEKIFENTGGEIASDERPVLSQKQKSCENFDQFIAEVQGLNFTSEETPPIPFVALSDLSPMEGAFSIEKISNKIFSLLEPKDLLNCRLVSSSWLRMATNDKLLRHSKNAIRIKHSLQWHDVPATVIFKNRKRRLENVTDLFDGLDYWAHPFLCSVSLDLELTMAENNFVEFFDRYGYAVNSLTLKFQAKENGEFFVYHMDSLLEFLTKILTEQMPNLETLDVEFERNAKFPFGIDPQLLLSIKNGLYCAGNRNENLRSIEFKRWTPYEVIETVFCLAPNVEELQVHDWGFWVTHKHRLCLLRTLEFTPSLDRWDKVSTLDVIVNSEEKVNLKKFIARLLYRPELFPHLATLVTRILQKSYDSLEELDLDPYFLLGTVFPPSMPKVTKLSLNSHPFWNSERNFSPQEISLVTTFPMLSTIECCGDTGLTRFLSLCKNEEVASVKKIKTLDCHVDENVFHKYFPNAVVTRHK